MSLMLEIRPDIPCKYNFNLTSQTNTKLWSFQGIYKADGSPLYPEGIQSDIRSMRAHKARVSTAPLAIVELHLESLSSAGSPGHVLDTMMQSQYNFPGALLFVEFIKFNVGTRKQRAAHQRKMANLLARLSK